MTVLAQAILECRVISVVDVQGILFQVEHVGSPPDLHSVRVLDGDYRPCGPNLALLFHNLLMLDDAASDEATRLLSIIVEDLPCKNET